MELYLHSPICIFWRARGQQCSLVYTTEQWGKWKTNAMIKNEQLQLSGAKVFGLNSPEMFWNLEK